MIVDSLWSTGNIHITCHFIYLSGGGKTIPGDEQFRERTRHAGKAVGRVPGIDQISIKTPNLKCRLFLKIDYLVKGLGGRCLRPPPLQGFNGVIKQFCRFGIWPILYTAYYSWSSSPHNPIPPFYTLYICIDLFLFTQGWGGGRWSIERVANTNMTECISSL